METKTVKRIILLTLAALILALSICFTSCDTTDIELTAGTNGATDNKNDATSAPAATDAHTAPKLEEIDFSTLDSLDGVNESASETDYVKITVKDYGEIIVRLYPDVAPKTVANFKKLVSEKFYDGLIFHRVIKNFMIQGGDPLGTGMGGSNTTIPGEFTSNKFENNLIHKKGVLSMARSSNPNSASSQFFICHKTSSHLDGDYASFGYVVYGIDVVDAIAAVKTNANDKPYDNVVIESIRFVSVPQQ